MKAVHALVSNYRLVPPNEGSAYSKRHKHLPGVPSAERMVEQGLDVVKTDALLLEKIEELTLHTISQEERIKALETRLLQLLEKSSAR